MELPVTKLEKGKNARVVKLAGGFGFQRKLRTIGIREGKTIQVLTTQPLGGPLVLSIDGRSTTIGRGMANRIMVEVE